jgi:hypothetical protein
VRYLRAITSIFKKKRIIFLGRVGLYFFDCGAKYFINSELAAARDFDVIIYNDDVQLVQGTQKITLKKNESKNILIKVREELAKMGIRCNNADSDLFNS